jgi:hypothetical protein
MKDNNDSLVYVDNDGSRGVGTFIMKSGKIMGNTSISDIRPAAV